VIARWAEDRIRRLAGQFPAVLILGPRQCGKTTLARHFVRGRYLDLEKPSDAQVFAGDLEFALRHLDGPVILDEAQVIPGLFPVLRALIDESRRKYGRYFLLGSVSPELVRNISESLAGRVGIVELTPFLLGEVAGVRRVDLDALWLRGGFPDALLTRDTARWEAWQENYVRTFIERDVTKHGLTMSPLEMRRFMGMLAHSHGGLLNASALGRSLGVTYHTVQHLLDLLEGYFLVRRLPPYHANLGKRLVKAPKIYLRDSGILHHLLGIGTKEQLFQSPARGNSFEGFMLEQLVARESLRNPGSRFFFFRTQTGIEVDLIVDRGQTRVGYEFKCAVSTDGKDVAHLKAALAEGVIHEGVLVYRGDRAFAVAEGVSVVPASALLSEGASDGPKGA
jgi:predicted AAA+ superfamily ATPase